MQPTPTVDRLAAPPTVDPAQRTQADEGAQLFWLNCQPCHGDQGQGLTDAADDDWRAQYPPEDQNCWKSGCHGRSPYEAGFTLPTAVPAVIGAGTLAKFATVADLHAYVSAAMPFNKPGSLSETEYWALTAFLARAHDVPGLTQALPLEDAEAAARLPLGAPRATAAVPPPGDSGLGQAGGLALGAAALAVGLAAVLGAWVMRRRKRTS
jgi:mono/diheme cytochrome c family protein